MPGLPSLAEYHELGRIRAFIAELAALSSA